MVDIIIISCVKWFFVDSCKQKFCEFHSKCIKKSDGNAECACPVCDKKEKYSPVCGDDGKTYASQCELEKASCERKMQIKSVKKVACGKYWLSQKSYCVVHSDQIILINVFDCKSDNQIQLS